MGQINFSHPTGTQEGQNLVGTHLLPCPGMSMILDLRFGCYRQGGCFNEAPRLFLVSKKRFDLPAEPVVASASLLQECGPLALCQLQG
jgi:hypothetical protein